MNSYGGRGPAGCNASDSTFLLLLIGVASISSCVNAGNAANDVKELRQRLERAKVIMPAEAIPKAIHE